MDTQTDPAMTAPPASPETLAARIDAALADISDAGAVRARLLAELAATREQALADAARRLTSERSAGLAVARDLADAMDAMVAEAFRVITTRVFPPHNPTDAERIAVLATGGYGRGTLAPGSDIDLLFLFPYKQTSWGESVVEYLLYLLWDLKLKVGQAVRSTDECIRLAREDITIRTAVLEARHITGDADLSATLKERLWKELFSKTGPEFVTAKLAERDARHRAMGDARYVVEPNIKDGKGGLRDLQTLFWIGKYLYNTRDAEALIEHGVFRREEYRLFIKAIRFLWTVRCHLHLLTGRAEERLTFDVQTEMAHRLGYRDHGGTRAVERFMKHYFTVAKDVGDLTRIFCAALEEQQTKPEPRLGRLLPAIFRKPAERRIEGFVVRGGRLDAAGDDTFETDPVNLIRLFHVADEAGLDIHPNALQLVRRSLKLVNADLRENAEANRLFLEIMTSRKDPETALRRMNEAGVLGRFVLDFGRIVALMQFNMYHHYTVDEHLIRTIGILSRIEKQELVEDHPLASKIIQGVLSRAVLYVSLFLHDIAKGRPQDHSTVGAKIARKLCPRLGMSDAETETVAWLVQNHLVMSDYAQKRDVTDPKTARDFAEIVQSPERLRLLLCLTVADIRAVGPGVWNGWKGELLRQLYYEAEAVIQGGHTKENRTARVAQAKAALAERLSDWPAKEREAYLGRHYDAYWLILDPDTQASHARLLREAGSGAEAFGFAAEPDTFRDVTRISVVMPDHPGIFARIAGALSLASTTIVDAKIFTSHDGMAVDTFWVQDQGGEAVLEDLRLDRIEQTIRKVLAGGTVVPEVLQQKRKRRTREQAFTVAPQVLVDNNASDTHTVLEVNARDRVGLLYDLTRALVRLNLSVSSAHIATYGERAVDVFYVKDMFGLKVTSEAKIRAIETEMLAAIAEKPKPKKAA